MVKQELIEKLSARTDLPQAQVIEQLTDILKKQFVKGDSVILRGFGTFKVVTCKEKSARDISKGVTITVPAHRVVKFQPSSELKALVKNEK